MAGNHEKENDLSDIRNFAFCGPAEGYERMLEHLAQIAENETWTFNKDEPLQILKKYIRAIFKQCYNQDLVLYSRTNECCCFNTGLLTPNGADILGFFVRNTRTDAQEWFFKGFYEKSDRQAIMNNFDRVPELAQFTKNYEEYYYDANKNVEMNIDHILDENWERLTGIMTGLTKSIVKSILDSSLDEAIRRARRNMRIVVPQFYMDQIMYLMPLRIPLLDGKDTIMALAIERTSQGTYRANTIFTKEMAYEKARVLMKPEANWLILK